MITLSNGHKFKYMAASGALGFFGEGWPWDKPLIWTGQLDPSLFTVVAKTVTLKPRKGNLKWYWPFGCVRFIKDGVVNSVGLTNPGYAWWQFGVRRGRAKNIPLMASIFSEASDAEKDLAYMTRLFSDIKIVGIEINASCPNTAGDVLKNTRRIIRSCEAVKRDTKHPLILKLSVVHDFGEILPNVKGVVEAISINSVPWRIAFPDITSPLAHLGGGGVSGKAAQPWTWNFVSKLSGATDIPIIGPSVWEYEDIAELRKRGAGAISFGSLFLRHPCWPSKFVLQDRGAD